MAPTTRTKPNTLAVEMAKKTREMILDLHVKRMILERQQNNGRLPDGKMEDILESLKSQGIDNATRCTIYNHEERVRRDTVSLPGSVPGSVVIDKGNNSGRTTNANSPVSILTEQTGTDASAVNKGGRPKGTSSRARMEADRQLSEAIECAATEIIKEQSQAKSSHTKLVKGRIKQIIATAHEQHSLKDHIDIPRETVMSRVKRGNAKGWEGNANTVTPMTKVEPILAALCIKLVRSGTPLDQASFLELATSLVEGTPTEELIKEHKQRCKHDINNTRLLGVRYYRSFLKRHGDKIKSMKASKKDNNRSLWGTYRNMLIVYEVIYAELTRSGVAEVLHEPVWMDINGNIVEKEEDAYGCKVGIKVNHPNYFIMGDETGCNTNMKADGHVGGKKYMGEAGTRGCNKRAIATDMHFTVLPFTNAIGEPVLCSVIFASDNKDGKIKSDWITGIDVTVEAMNIDDGVQFVTHNTGPGRYMPRGPSCVVNGITVPCYVCCSPHGGITGTLLTDMLRYMDELALFPRTNDLMPLLLLDGHGSRFDLEFLQHINNKDHEWSACIGVPYGTHLWQVGDASSMNGTFKIGITKAKEELMAAKEQRFMNSNFLPTDIIPIVNRAWSKSFANVAYGKKALAERGWNPLNMALLKNKEVLDTKQDDGASTNNSNDALSILTQAAVASANGAAVVQVNEGKSADIIDILVADRDRAQQRQKALDRKLLAQNATAAYDRTKKLTSSKMVVSGKHRLSIDVMEQVTDYVKFKVEQEEDRLDKRVKKQKVLMVKVERAKAMDESAWTSEQCKAMVQYYKQDNDPRMATGLVGLKDQWSTRRGRASPAPFHDGQDQPVPPLRQQAMDENALLGLGDDGEEEEDDQRNII